MKQFLCGLLCLLLMLQTNGQKGLPAVEVLTQGTKASLRGLSVVDDKTVWVSGSGGTVGRSTDGGATWKWMQVKGHEKRDFRDIEAFDSTTAIIMAIDTPAYILKTVDGGETWKPVYQNSKEGMFLDAMEFRDSQSGIVVGDPIDGRLFMAVTNNGGDTWEEIPFALRPTTLPGEAMFASSGTNIRSLTPHISVMVTGGTHSRIFFNSKVAPLPLMQGGATTGANSIAVGERHKWKGCIRMVVVGGDFTRPALDSLNCFYSRNSGKRWKSPQRGPGGYRSCVEYLSKKAVLTCGLTGVDYSEDGGRNWKAISREGFHVCRKAKSGNAVFLAGGGGKIGKLVQPAH